MQREWDVGKPTGACSATGRPLAEGEEYYAVLFEENDTFRRADYSLDAWTGPPEGTFCHFRSRIPVQQGDRKPRLLVDDDMLVAFFLRLASEDSEARQQFRFVLALILMRKRILRYEESVQTDEGDVWVMRLMGDKSEHRVLNPRLNDKQIVEVSRQLGEILNTEAFDEADESSASATA